MNFDQYLQSLKAIIDEEKTFNIKFYVINNDIEKKIEAAINMIFEKYNRIDIAGVIYTCVKELIINGTKANLKRVLFNKNGLDINDSTQYIKGMMEFRNALNEETYQTYLKDLQEGDYWVNVKFEYNPDGVRIIIVNNTHISKIEDQRLREKLKKAMGYDDIAQFYIDQGDELEGAGMGIALIVMLLKGINVDPALFRIGNTPNNQTFARIEIPLSDKYVPVRNRKETVD